MGATTSKVSEAEAAKARAEQERRRAAATDPTKPLDWVDQFGGRQVYTQFVEPCAEASKQAMDCLASSSKEGGDGKHDKKCQEYFENYRKCKKRWMEQRRQDRRDGKPSLPV